MTFSASLICKVFMHFSLKSAFWPNYYLLDQHLASHNLIYVPRILHQEYFKATGPNNQNQLTSKFWEGFYLIL